MDKVKILYETAQEYIKRKGGIKYFENKCCTCLVRPSCSSPCYEMMETIKKLIKSCKPSYAGEPCDDFLKTFIIDMNKNGKTDNEYPLTFMKMNNSGVFTVSTYIMIKGHKFNIEFDHGRLLEWIGKCFEVGRSPF